MITTEPRAIQEIARVLTEPKFDVLQYLFPNGRDRSGGPAMKLIYDGVSGCEQRVEGSMS
jgi:hypothetical protein